MNGQIERLRNMSRNVGMFWICIMYVGLTISTVATFVNRPGLLRQWQGWAILMLTATFGLWYWFGNGLEYGILGMHRSGGARKFRRGGLVSRDRDDYWRERINGTQQGVHWPSIIYWAVLLAINLALVAFDTNYKWVLFAVYGISMFVMALPRSLWLTVPTAALIFVVLGWVPTDGKPEDWIRFISGVFIFVIYSATGYIPILLIRGRFARERMFEQLERSHRELEEAHRQLADAAARDRELAVLRERARLGRDMHDTLGHSLALIAVKLEAAQRLRAVDADRADHEVAATQIIAREALAELRAAIANLRGPLVTSVPLSEALVREARDAAARASWQLACDVSPEISLDERLYEGLLRVGGEALANAERHAHASEVRLSLVREGDDVVLRVRDDGVGILTTNPPRGMSPVPAIAAGGSSAQPGSVLPAKHASASAPPLVEITSPSGHYGITGMRERITSLGGRFTIGPADEGRGTVVEVRILAARR